MPMYTPSETRVIYNNNLRVIRGINEHSYELLRTLYEVSPNYAVLIFPEKGQRRGDYYDYVNVNVSPRHRLITERMFTAFSDEQILGVVLGEFPPYDETNDPLL